MLKVVTRYQEQVCSGKTVLSTRKVTVLRWGQNWVTLGIILKLPSLNERYICLPIIARYCRKKQPYSKKEKSHETRCQLMFEMLCLLASWFPYRKIVHVVDGAYANNTVLLDRPKMEKLTPS